MIVLCLCWFAGCNRQSTGDSAASDTSAGKAADNYTASERAAAAKLKQVRDPIEEEIYKSRQTRQLTIPRFDHGTDAERSGARSLSSAMAPEEASSMSRLNSEDDPVAWNCHQILGLDAAKPQSLLRDWLCGFPVDYCWHARGHEYANKVTPKC